MTPSFFEFGKGKTPEEIKAEVKAHFDAMSPEELRKISLTLVDSVNQLSFNVLAANRIAKSQGRGMMSEDELGNAFFDSKQNNTVH